MIKEFSTLDAILDAHSAALGPDATPYRNHAYRVANLCFDPVAERRGGT